MRKYLLITILTLVAVLLQESFSWEFFGQALNPSFLVAICFAFLLADDHDGALFSAFIGGLWLDLTGVGIVGLSAFILVLFLYFAIWVRKSFLRVVWVQAVLSMVATILFKLILNFPELNYSASLFFSGLLSALLSWVLFNILKRTKHRYLSFEFRIKA